jgi:hypothetical protein
MTFDYTSTGEVKVTMDSATDDIIATSGDKIKPRATPATEELFATRESAKASEEEAAFFRSQVAKLLYLAKRVRPECLTAVAFLTTRAQHPDSDDMAKLRRVLGYVAATRHRGIVIKFGDSPQVHGYIDAAYGVHSDSRKSHTGCAVIIGHGGPVHVKSAKQKIVTKASTEAELVGLSDSAGSVIHCRNFLLAQGLSLGPAILHQDNQSTMALVKRGRACSERTRHIDIRYFWIKERVDAGEVIIQYLKTTDMHANALTKPVQGAQFIAERKGLTNWPELGVE